MNKTLIIFDLISTLTNAGPRYARAFGDVCKQFGVTPPDDDDVLSMLGNKNLKEITNHFAGSLEDDKKVAFMSSCNTVCDALLFNVNWIEKLYDGAYETLETLEKQGYSLGIFTGTRQSAAESQLEYHKIKSFFNPNYIRAKRDDHDSATDTKELKTQQLSEIIAAFKKDSGINTSVIVVGDSESDFYAASALGLDFIGYTTSTYHKQRLLDAGAKTIIDSYANFPVIEKTLHVGNGYSPI